MLTFENAVLLATAIAFIVVLVRRFRKPKRVRTWAKRGIRQGAEAPNGVLSADITKQVRGWRPEAMTTAHDDEGAEYDEVETNDRPSP